MNIKIDIKEIALLFAIVLLITMIVASFKVLNFSSIRIENIPTTQTLEQDKIYKIQDEHGIPSIYLASSIGDPDTYQSLIMYLNSNRDVSEMNIYLSGTGGDVRSTINLINTMNDSPTKFHMKVYGDVYSAHAFLAVNGDTLTVTDEDIIFLFHVGAVSIKGGTALTGEEFCITLLGTDRGLPRSEKCSLFNKKLEEQFEHVMIKKLQNILTGTELQEMRDGADILLSWKEIKSRTEGR